MPRAKAKVVPDIEQKFDPNYDYTKGDRQEKRRAMFDRMEESLTQIHVATGGKRCATCRVVHELAEAGLDRTFSAADRQRYRETVEMKKQARMASTRAAR